MPLGAQGRQIGLFGIYRNRPHWPAFTEADRQMAQDLANRAALAIMNAQLLVHLREELQARQPTQEELRRANMRLQVLADAAKRFDEVRVYQALVEQIAQTSTTVLGDGCQISLASMDGESMDLVVLDDVDPEKRELLRHTWGGGQNLSNLGLVMHVYRMNQPILIPVVDPQRWRTVTDPVFWPLLDRLGLRSVLGVPMRAQGTVIGVLLFARHRSEQPYDERDLQLAQDLADRAALAS